MSGNPRLSRGALLFVVLLVLIDATSFGLIIPVTPHLIVELTGETVSQASIYGGWLFFAFAIVQFFAAPVLGNLSDRFGRRPVLLLSLVAFAIDYLIMALAPTLVWLFVGRILAGIPGAAYSPAYAYIADVSAPEERAKNFGLVGAAFGIGFIAGPAIGGLLAVLGPRAPFYAAATLAFLNFALGYFVLRESLPKESRRAFSWARANPLGAIVAIRAYPRVAALAVVLFLWSVAGQVYPATWSFFTILRFGWSEALVGASLAFVGILMAVSQGALPGVLMPRFGERRVVLVALAAGAVGFLGYAFATASWMMFAWLGTWFLAGLVMPGVNAMMSKEVPASAQGELQGVNASLMSLSAIVGVPIMSQLFGRFSAAEAPLRFPGAAFAAAALLAFLAIGLFVTTARGRGTPSAAPDLPVAQASGAKP